MPTLDDVPIDLQLCFVVTTKKKVATIFLNHKSEMARFKLWWYMQNKRTS